MAPHDNGVRVPAQTIGELDVHLSYLQGSIKEVVNRLDGMATKEDIEAISHRLTEFATKTELKRLSERVDDISPSNVMTLARNFLLTIAAFAAAVGAVVAVIRWVKPGAL
jgi:hypothetical protein